MDLNKSSSYVLLNLLQGYTKSAKINERMPDIDVRSIQRALDRLVNLQLIQRNGASNNPTYSIKYENLLGFNIASKLLEDESRPKSSFNHKLIDWFAHKSSAELTQTVIPQNIRELHATPIKMPVKDLEYLTVELSWKSSALEGNTYTLLDTQLLLTEGIKAKNRTEFETQMIFNHKDAISFIVENPELFANDIGLRQ